MAKATSPLSDIIAESPNRLQPGKRGAGPKVVLKTPQSLVHIKHSISLKQYKLWILMLKQYKEKYDKGELTDSLLIIPKSQVDQFFGYENAKHEIQSDLEALRKEPIIFNVLNKDGEKEQHGLGFISEWTLSATKIGFLLPTYIAEAVQKLESARIFSLLNLSIFNHFSGKYEALLYKLCADYVGIRRTPEMTIEAYREYMGLKPGEYEAGRDLNKFIIQAPVDKINKSEICDIQVEPVYKRLGRKIVGVHFKIEQKKQASLPFPADPAFAHARLPIPLQQQERYLSLYAADAIALSIERANAYIDTLKSRGASVDMGAIYNKAIEENWGEQLRIQKQTAEQERAEKAARKAEELAQVRDEEELKAREAYVRDLQTKAIKAMDKEALRVEAMAYLKANPDKERFYDAAKVGFTNPIERIGFNIWLQGRVQVEVDDAEFGLWRQSRSKRPAR
jgi:hypothetical protein